MWQKIPQNEFSKPGLTLVNSGGRHGGNAEAISDEKDKIFWSFDRIKEFIVQTFFLWFSQQIPKSIQRNLEFVPSRF